MHIPSYQVLNVLKFYSKKLGITSLNEEGDGNVSSLANHIQISTELKRQRIIEKIANDIFEKIIHVEDGANILEDDDPLSIKHDKLPRKDKIRLKEENISFIYHTIDENNVKRRNTLCVEDSAFLIRRMEQQISEQLLGGL